jgi:TolA-binding protein
MQSDFEKNGYVVVDSLISPTTQDDIKQLQSLVIDLQSQLNDMQLEHQQQTLRVLKQQWSIQQQVQTLKQELQTLNQQRETIEQQKINLKTLQIGSIITVRYDIILTTFTNNTEVWFRTYISESDFGPTTFAGNLKYQFSYDMSLEHTFFIESDIIKNYGATPQILTDNDASMIVKSMYISVR